MGETMTYMTIMLILFTHWMADFVYQTDEMAINKSTSIVWLNAHVSAYSIVWICPAVLLFPYDTNLAFAFVLINAVLHWFTDYVTSRINSRLWQRESKHDFFVMVGFDQLIHYACLFGSYGALS
jgi:Protein of unknown function (DUF3307)